MLYIDAQNAGISGDMIIAALLNMGAKRQKIDDALSPISDTLGKYTFEEKIVKRGPFHGTNYRFNFEDREISYSEARDAIERSGLSKKAGSFALSCFKTLTDAEALVHGVNKERLHLHDAPDTVSDFTVAASLLDDLDILGEKVLSSPVNTGKGFFTFHGTRSTLPAPATAEILKGKPVFGDIDMELTTPTGAAILVNLADEFVNEFPLMKIQKIGCGAGYRDLDFPNILKLYLGEETDAELIHESLVLLETNVDTATGETVGYLFERLLEDGALDVVVIPCIMKKNRPGHIIQVMCQKEDAEKLSKTLMLETGSLGVRINPETHRHVLKRKISKRKVKINGMEFTVNFKTASHSKGTIVSERAEFEDVKKIARKTGLSLREVEHILNS